MISFEIAGHISGEIETNRQEFFNPVVLCCSFKNVRLRGSLSAIESDYSSGLVEPDGDDRDIILVFAFLLGRAQSVLLGGGETLGPRRSFNWRNRLVKRTDRATLISILVPQTYICC